MRDTFGTVMSSPLTTGLPMRLLLKMPAKLSSTAMWVPGGMLGARTTLTARPGSILSTLTFSPMETPAEVLVRPSILMIPEPASSGSLRNILATAVFLPVILTMLPMVSSSDEYASGSRRALP